MTDIDRKMLSVVNSDDSLYAIVLLVLYVLKDEPKFKDLSRIAFIVGRKSFDELVDIYGGEEIRIPTRDEVNRIIKILTYYQLRYVEGKPAPIAAKESGIDIGLMVGGNTYRFDNRLFSKISNMLEVLDWKKLR